MRTHDPMTNKLMAHDPADITNSKSEIDVLKARHMAGFKNLINHFPASLSVNRELIIQRKNVIAAITDSSSCCNKS